MNRNLILLSALALLGNLGITAAQNSTAPPATTTSPPANTHTAAGPLTLTLDSLKGAHFVTLPTRVEGDASVISSDQLQQAIAAINRNLGVALQRKYPGATVDSILGNASAVTVTPVLVAPKSLTMFDALVARLEVRLPGDPRTYVVKQSYGLISLATAGGNADMVVLNGLMAQLP